MPDDRDLYWMGLALDLARKAQALGEVPVGAVLVREDLLLGEGWNCPISCCDPTAHAEIRALRAAATAVGNYRLPGTILYSTLEPCAMCAGALLQARIERLVYAAPDPRAGAVNSQFMLLSSTALNHRINWRDGVLAEESATLLREFFRARRG